MRTTRLVVTMNEVEPVVRRVVDVPAAVRLPELHDLLQVALGWTDSHLHDFVVGAVVYGMPGTDAPEDDLDETAVRLRALPARFLYRYDFGDGWEHQVEVIGPGGDRAGVVAGEGACPPEDVGGSHGYADFLRAWANPRDPEHDDWRTWAGAWKPLFDLSAADLLVQEMAGAVPAPVLLVLGLVDGGVPLAPAGGLPPAVVRQVEERYPEWNPLDEPAAVEDDLPPLAILHVLLRHVGLLRLRHGILSPTRAAADETEVIRRLRTWFEPVDEFSSLLAGVTVALLAAYGPSRPEDLAGRLLELVGDRWVTGEGQPLGAALILRELRPLSFALRGLDLVRISSEIWTAGPSARWLLPRATLLAHLWSGSPGPPRPLPPI